MRCAVGASEVFSFQVAALLPGFKADLARGREDAVLEEILVVAGGVVIAEVRAAALGAGEGAEEDGVGDAGHGLRLGEPAAVLALVG